MYWLIEEDNQIEVLINSGYKKAFIEVIPYSDNNHPINNKVSLLYIRPLGAQKGFMICVSHSETFSVNNTLIDTLLSKFDVLYCRDKKQTLHYYPLKALYDINRPPNPYIRPTTQTHDIFYYKNKDKDDINTIIPVVKHFELCENIFNDLKENINQIKTPYAEFFNTKTSLVFNAIERSGIQIHNKTFGEYFYDEKGSKVYTQYNLKTLTSRPSNKFKGVNYAALNKENGCRKAFIPANNIFYEIDISAYHPSLSCRLIDYNFPTVDIHDHMAKLYGVSYAKSKELTFKQLYGGVFKQYEHLDYFKKIKKYINKLWNDFKEKGWVECPVSGYHFDDSKLENMNPQKLFNYSLQCLETSMNVRILWDVLKLLRGKKTKLVLYTYDSFLFDVDEKEIKIINEVKEVFNKYKFNIKSKQGYDYQFGDPS